MLCPYATVLAGHGISDLVAAVFSTFFELWSVRALVSGAGAGGLQQRKRAAVLAHPFLLLPF